MYNLINECEYVFVNNVLTSTYVILSNATISLVLAPRAGQRLTA